MSRRTAHLAASAGKAAHGAATVAEMLDLLPPRLASAAGPDSWMDIIDQLTKATGAPDGRRTPDGRRDDWNAWVAVYDEAVHEVAIGVAVSGHLRRG